MIQIQEMPSSNSVAILKTSPWLLCRIRVIQGGPQSFRELGRVLIRPEVHKEEPWLFRQRVAVYRRHINPVFPQGLHYWIDFLSQQHEVAADRGFAFSGGLEVERRRDTIDGSTTMAPSVIVSARGTPNCKIPPLILPLRPRISSTFLGSNPFNSAAAGAPAASGRAFW
jgi:hypothetical protein